MRRILNNIDFFSNIVELEPASINYLSVWTCFTLENVFITKFLPECWYELEALHQANKNPNKNI